MQSGFGTGGGGGSGGGSGVSEMQQFMVEGCTPSSSSTSLFSISTSNNNLHHHPHHHHHQHHHHHPLQPPPHFPHFQSIPITQQLFHQAHHFQLFTHPHHQELGLDLESGPENSNSGAVQPGTGAPSPSFLTAAMSFKLGVNDNSSREDDGILHGDDGTSDSHVHPWQREEESTIKEPFWRPLDIDYINSKRSTANEKPQQLQESSGKYCKKTNKEVNEQQGHNNGNNYKLFSELEAIYKPGNNNVLGGGDGGGGGGGGSSSANNQTGSGSALTGDENPLMTLVAPGPISEQQPISTINQISDTSTGEEAAPVKKHIKTSGRRKRKRRQQQLSSLTAFFENMVKQLMDHQEGLHRKFLEVIEKRDRDRVMLEETWRKEEAAKTSRETALRDQERALASSREAAIISFLEKITGETLNLPTMSQFQLSQKSYHSQHHQQHSEDNAEHAYDHPLDLSQEFMNNNDKNNGDVNNNQIHMSSSRWPKAEVQALIRVRSSLEMRFQEPGLKGPLWEEVSSLMASMGYCRSSKRCKEKWENINKYFRKTKESGKKRPVHSKTCPYFHQLDQLYSKSLNNNNNNKQLPPPPTQVKDNSELLDAIVLNNGHEGDDDDDDDQHDEEHQDKEEGVAQGKHQQHEHLFQSLDS